MTNLEYLKLSAKTKVLGTDVLYGSNKLSHIVLSSEAAYQLRYYFGNNINFIPTTLTTLEFAEGSNSFETILTNNNIGNIKNIIFASDTLSIPDNFFGTSTIAQNIENITLPNGLVEIGTSAFYGASSLTSITIPNGVTSIGASAFAGASSLTSITIPNGVTSIGASAFAGASSLTSMTLPFVGNTRTSTGTSGYFGYLFGTTTYTGSYSANGYYLPNTLTEVIITDATQIGASAFDGASSLTSITIPDSVTSIGASAFRGARSLTSITIPNGVTSIGGYTFYGAHSLTSITIPDSVTSIGHQHLEEPAV